MMALTLTAERESRLDRKYLSEILNEEKGLNGD